MSTNKHLKEAISKLLSEKINQAYFEITKDETKIFKFEYNWSYDGNYFRQYDEQNGNVIIDEYNNDVKYIPCAVQSIIGEREEIPDIYITDIIVPISMLVFDISNLDIIETVLSYFSNKNIGKIYNLEVYNSINLNNDTYKFSFTIDMPDFDNFEQFQGENAKAVVFQLDGTLTQGNLFYGNDIDYELSIDNGATYEKLIRFNPSSTRHINTFTNQEINKISQTSVEQDNLWSFLINVLVIKNSNIEKLLPFADERDYTKLGYSVDYLDNLKLKIKYNNLNLLIEKNIVLTDISYSASYGDFLILQLRFLDKLNDNDIEEI